MAETIEYNGSTYRRAGGKWVDKNNMVVTHLQRTLDNLYAKQQSSDALAADALIAEGDRYKEGETYHLAIQQYVKALENGDPGIPRKVLPRLTSCYRLQGRAQKAIEVFESALSNYGTRILSAPLCTSIAAAYCDIQDYEAAKRYANKAYALSDGKSSGELKGVYGRIRKETTGSGAYDGD